MEAQKPKVGLLSKIMKFAALPLGSPTTSLSPLDFKAIAAEEGANPVSESVKQVPSIKGGLGIIAVEGGIGGVLATGGVAMAMSATPVVAIAGALGAAWAAKEFIIPGMKEGVSEIIHAVRDSRNARPGANL